MPLDDCYHQAKHALFRYMSHLSDRYYHTNAFVTDRFHHDVDIRSQILTKRIGTDLALDHRSLLSTFHTQLCLVQHDDTVNISTLHCLAHDCMCTDRCIHDQYFPSDDLLSSYTSLYRSSINKIHHFPISTTHTHTPLTRTNDT